MAELDEQRIAELAKEPPRVLGGAATEQAQEEARAVVETQALMRRGAPGQEGCH